MPDGIIPPFMEDVAKAGGWEEHARMKEQKELLEAMEKIPVEKFRDMKDMLGKVESLFNVAGGSDLGILSGLTESIKDTITTEINAAIAPLKNELIAGINTALAPIMPYIEVAINALATAIGLGFSAWTALFTGKWADFEKRLEAIFPGITEWREDFRVSQTNLFWGGGLGTAIIDANLAAAGLPSVAELNDAGIAGGVYSGTFDGLDYDAITAMLAALDLPTYDEEE